MAIHIIFFCRSRILSIQCPPLLRTGWSICPLLFPSVSLSSSQPLLRNAIQNWGHVGQFVLQHFLYRNDDKDTAVSLSSFLYRKCWRTNWPTCPQFWIAFLNSGCDDDKDTDGKSRGQIDQPVLRRGGHWMDKIRERQKKMMWMAISQRNEKQHYSRFLLEAVPLDVVWRIFWGYSDDPSDLRPIHAQKRSSIILSQRNKSWMS